VIMHHYWAMHGFFACVRFKKFIKFCEKSLKSFELKRFEF
jgi:hypothetical protein